MAFLNSGCGGRWFLNWAIRKGYCHESQISKLCPKFKVLEKPVIFLTKEELMHMYHFEVPGNGERVKLKTAAGKEYVKIVEDAGGLAKTSVSRRLTRNTNSSVPTPADAPSSASPYHPVFLLRS